MDVQGQYLLIEVFSTISRSGSGPRHEPATGWCPRTPSWLSSLEKIIGFWDYEKPRRP